jgi:hypothetical protein
MTLRARLKQSLFIDKPTRAHSLAAQLPNFKRARVLRMAKELQVVWS